MNDRNMTASCHIATLTANPSLDLSAEVDAVEPIRKLRCTAARCDPGGGGINVARVIRRLGGDALAVFAAGGMTGRRLEALVQAEGIRIFPVEIAGETREDFTVLEKRSGRQYRFVLPGPMLAPDELSKCVDALSLCGEAEFVVTSGSLPPGAPPDFYVEVAKRAKAAGRKTVVDTSGPALAAVLAEGVYLVKPNARELAELTGKTLGDEAACLAAARDIVGRGGAEIVALSLAEKGARLVTRKDAWRAHAPSVTPVSTVGAGDSFVGALVLALTRGAALPEALRRAVAAGTAALLSEGTELCRAETVERLLPQVGVEQIQSP